MVYIDADALVMGGLDEVTVLHIDFMDYSSLHRSAYLYVVQTKVRLRFYCLDARVPRYLLWSLSSS